METGKSSARKSIERGGAVAMFGTLISGVVIAYDLIQGARIQDFLNGQSQAHTVALIFLGGLGCSLSSVLLPKLFGLR